MTQAIKIVAKEIRNGENLDLYATIFAAIVATILNIFDLAPNELIASLTLAVLALLSITSLVNRYRLESTLESIVQSKGSFFMKEHPDTKVSDIEHAQDLLLVGVSLHRTIRTHYSLFERKLQRGDKINILLVHPNGPSVDIVASRSYALREIDQTITDIKSSLNWLQSLHKRYQNRLEIRTISHPVAYGAIAVNIHSDSGTLYLEHYPFRTAGESHPKFILYAKDGEWYTFYRGELSNLWESAQEWNYSQVESTTTIVSGVNIIEGTEQRTLSLETYNDQNLKSYFLETFDSELDTNKWAVNSNSGTVIIADSHLQLSSNLRAAKFPYIHTVAPCIPPSGNFSVQIEFQYTNVGICGTGIVISVDVPDNQNNNHTDTNPEWKRIWQDAEQFLLGAGHLQAPDTTRHNIEFRWLESIDECLIDGKSTSKNVHAIGQKRPTTIWIGNYVNINGRGHWSSIKIDTIRVVEIP